MKKILLLVALPCMVSQLNAQNTSKDAPPPPPPPPPPAKFAKPAPPPPPPPATARFTPPKVVKNENVKFRPPVIVNEKGYSISVRHINGKDMVEVKNSRMRKLIKLSDWNADPARYEKLYGELPPPPPPPPAPPVIKE